MTIKQYLFWTTGAFVFTMCFVSIIKSCSPEPNPSIEKTAEARKHDIKKSDSLGVIVDSVIVDRWRTKTKYQTIVDSVYVMDSATVKLYYDSLVRSQLNALVLFYKHQSCSTELYLMDSAHVLDSLRIALLTSANMRCDTLLAEADKRAKKRFWAGFKIGFGTGYAAGIGTAAVVK